MSYWLHAARDPLERMKQAFLSVPTQVKRFWVAFSGGLDSSVLLHATRQLFPQQSLTAIHINHGLQPQAPQWEKHCQAICDALAVPLVVYQVAKALHQHRQAGYSPEDAARKTRYAALTRSLNQEDCLLTAHHLEDQAETVVLQLMRGAGVQGLGSMRLLSRCRSTYHLRPLLHWTRPECLAYAHQHQLQWIEDPSNQDQRFMRNFIRHTILPILKQRWPKSSQTLGRTAAHCAQASQLCTELAITDLSPCEVDNQQLSIRALLALSSLRRRNALRYWLQRELSNPPSAAQFEQIEQLLYATPGTDPAFCFQSIMVKRYRDSLYLLREKTKHLQSSIRWHTAEPLYLPDWGTLTAIPRQGKGIRIAQLAATPVLNVQFRQGGEQFQPKGRIGSHPLKKLFQEWAIPPWERYQWPLIYQNNQLIAVPGHAVAEQSAAHPEELGLWISTTCSTTIAY